MEQADLRWRFDQALKSITDKFSSDPKCLAGFLIGSMSHDLIWEWSDLQILLIYDDSYKGPKGYYLSEQDTPVVVNIRTRNCFKSYLESTNVADYFYCALSKSRLLFAKDQTLREYFEDMFYIGDRDREIEMLLGFSETVYYLDKAEKNFRVKGNSVNAIYFAFQIAQAIAWLEVARQRLFPEREIIAQAARINPALFAQIYDPLFSGPVTDEIIERIIQTCHAYLKQNTIEVYRPILDYLREHRTLRGFTLPTRPHGFGINYEWLYRIGIIERYTEPIRINDHSAEFCQIEYRIKDEYSGLTENGARIKETETL